MRDPPRARHPPAPAPGWSTNPGWTAPSGLPTRRKPGTTRRSLPPTPALHRKRPGREDRRRKSRCGPRRARAGGHRRPLRRPRPAASAGAGRMAHEARCRPGAVPLGIGKMRRDGGLWRGGWSCRSSIREVFPSCLKRRAGRLRGGFLTSGSSAERRLLIGRIAARQWLPDTCMQGGARAGRIPGYSGGTAADFHRIPRTPGAL